jgi:multiple sugar transport system ATP-binding protein
VGGLELSNVRKAFGETLVLESISLAMEANEFIAFLGPSGSGKSTLLRIIAGLETADSGEIMLEGRRIDALPPGDRGVAMVFQHYALYPHMSVRDNMAFGLKNAGVARSEIAERIQQAATVLEIDALLDRKPGQLSGGQRQRVAIGRAIVKKPKLFLLDEPLSNLDAALRNRTRVELAQLRHRVEAGVIMVTHDQAEAMTLADRIIVMNDKRIQQIGTPMEVYSRPANTFVACFVGSPAIALLQGRLAGEGQFARVVLEGGTEVATRVPVADLPAGSEITLGLRPEHVHVAPAGSGAAQAEVILVERLGDRTFVYARLPNGQELTAVDAGDSRVRIGDAIGLAIDGPAAHIFGPDGAGFHPAASA